MRRKLILFLMLALFGSSSFLRADELTVHDGTTTNNLVPLYGFYADAYLKCEMVYPATELTDMANGTISGLTFYTDSPASDAWTATFQVFVAEVENATISDFAGPGTIVYEGTLDGTQETMTITFNEPYAYNGGNLLVGVYCIETGNFKQVYWVGETVEGASVQGYSYSSLSAVNATQRNFLPKTTFSYEGGGTGPTPPTPPTPTGELVVTPNPFTLGERPLNGWMEPYAVRIYNGAEPVLITASMSNTAGANAFSMSQEIYQVALATGDELSFTIDINHDATAGEYTEEFTMFVAEDNRDIVTIPVTSTFYTAGEADIVETAKTLSLNYSNGVANFSHTPADLHANYLLAGMTQMTTDAVYKVTLAKDAKVTVNQNVAFYTYVSGFQPSAAVTPMFTAAADEQIIVLAGEYYMIVTGNAITTVSGTVEQVPAPTELTFVDPTPEDGATEVESPVTIAWEGGENATQYQVLFGTSPVNMPAVVDWTMVDENYGSFTVTGLQANTQYFYQVKAKNSNGTVQTVRRGFTTTLTAPNTVTASEVEIFVDGSTLIKWKHSTGAMGDLPETQIGEGTATSNYLPTYNLYNYSLTEQIYTGEEIGEAGYINSISFHPVGNITRNLKVYMANTDKTSFASGSDWVAMEADNLVFEGDVEMIADTWVTIDLNDPFEFDGSNLILVVTDHTGTWTSSIYYSTFDATAQAINVYQDSGPYNALAPAGSGTVRNFKNQIIINKDGAKDFAQNRGFLGYNVYYGDVKANTSLITEKQYLLQNLPYNIDPGHDINVTAVYEEGESGHSTPIVTVKVSGYGTLTGHVYELISGEPVADATVRFFGLDEFGNDVNYEGTTNANGAYTINNVKAGTYNRGVASLAGMENANMASPVTLAYEGTETVDFIIHETYNPVLSVYAEELDPSLAKVSWSLNTMITGGGNAVGGGDEFSVDFENSALPAGWTTIDADGDGDNWQFASALMGAGYGHNGSTDCILSRSYDNSYGPLTPNNFLVSPQVTVGAGSTFSFYACAQDASYAAEHFGVGVSTTSATASAFTMVQEWTMTAKGSNVMAPGRDGQTRAQGNWYQYTVDLSAYAGQQIYIAIRHFNCTDWFYLDVDDIALTAASKDRSVQQYAVYRKALLLENGVTDADSVFFGTVNAPDTLYADFDWINREAGLYQYGVSAIYPSLPDRSDRSEELTVYEGTQTNNHVPMYVFYFDDWARTQFVIPAEDLSEMAGGTISALKFYTTSSNIPYTTVSPFIFYVKEVDYTTISAYEATESCQTVYSGYGEFVAEGAGGMITITFDTPYQYNGGNLLIGCENTMDNGYKSIYFYGTTVNGASISGSNSNSTAAASVSQQNFIPMTTFVYEAGAATSNDDPVTDITWSNILPKDMETTVNVTVTTNAGNPTGANINFVNTFNEEITYSAVIDSTDANTVTVSFPEFYKGPYTLTVDLEGFISNYAETEVNIWGETEINVLLEEQLKAVDNLTVSNTGFANWTPVVQNRAAEKYFLTLDGMLVAQPTDNYFIFTDIEEGEHEAGVAVVYTTGLSEYVYCTFIYTGCDEASQVEDLAVDPEYTTDMNVALVWGSGTVTPTPPTPPTPPTGNTFDFDDGTFQGWTTIDGNNDGYDWVLGSQIGGVYLVTGASLAGSGHNSSADLVCSGSYSNATSSAITPNNFLVSPAKAEYTGISFWACGQDASYVAEHFGVAVSTAGNTSASDFTIVQEWTMTAKDGGAMSIGRDGQVRAQGSWHEYTVDLSAYAGQEIWVAIRHFNCNDMFILDVDDITLGVPGKSADAETCGVQYPAAPSDAMWDLLKDFNGTSGYQYGVATDGNFIYTSSWSASSTSMFYKYDMDGNFIEEFNVSGCGQIRDLTYDGEYFYGVANSSTIYCVDLANHALVGTTTSAYGAMRCCAYDSQRDGFWVVGNWSGNLTLVDRTGAIVQTGPAPTSASGVAYYKDADGVEHVLCFNNGDNGVYDYNITTNTMGGQVFNYNNAPGTGSGSSGGCHIANYGDKLAFYGDIQSSPQYIAIYELGPAQGGGNGGNTSANAYQPNKFNILVDGVVVGATSDEYYIYECPDYDMHVYTVVWVDGNYNVSCEVSVEYQILPLNVSEFDVVNTIYPNPTSGDLHINANGMVRISIVNTLGQMVYNQAVKGDETVINMAQFEAGIYMVNIVTSNGSSVKRIVVTK